MSRLIIVLICMLLLIPQSTVATQGDDTELRIIEAEDPLVQQQGEWTLIDDPDNASGEGYLVSSGEPDDEIGLLFEGTQIEVVYLTGRDYGTFHIEVDNEVVQTINAASNEPQFGVRVVVEDLASGFHIIRVIAEDGTVAVDRFEITPSEGTELAQVLPERSIRGEDEIIKNLHNNGSAWAIISFQLPLEFVFETRLEVDQRTRQRANIALIQDTILQELSEFEVTALRRSVLFPDMTLVITNVDAFLRLKELPYVTSIRESGIGTPQQYDDKEPRFIEAEDPIVQQQGAWTLVDDPDNASSEVFLVSSGEPDDELGLLFEGTQIDVIYLTGPDYGTFLIDVDNEIVQTVDATSDERQFDVRAVVEDLASGFHIIRIIADSGVVAVDGFEITPSSQPVSLFERTDYHNRLLTHFDYAEKIMVTVRYHVPPEFVLETRLETETERLEQRASNALVRDTLLLELAEYDIEIISNIENELSLILPTITLLADKGAYERLLQLPYITFVRRDVPGNT